MAMTNGSDKVETEAQPPSPAPRTARSGRPRLIERLEKIRVKRQNEQSSIAFPYVDLETSISVAQAIFSAGGVPVSRDQLAGLMNTTSGSGTFLMKVAAARMFGVIAYAQGKYELTTPGFSILEADETRQKAARATAFLNIPLYRRVYEEFKGKQLPPRPRGLEQAFAKFGVASKQTSSARLAFDKSATQAGFFSAGPERLIEPIIGGAGGPTGPTNPNPSGPSRALVHAASLSVGESGAELGLDPLIQGLLRRLPKSGEAWEADKRARWLQTLAANFDMVYTSDEDDKIIIIECKSQKTI
jgi:hypothetical protein